MELGKITGVAWLQPGIGIVGTICIVTINNGFDDKAYIKMISTVTNEENDAMSTARSGSPMSLVAAKLVIGIQGNECDISYKIG